MTYPALTCFTIHRPPLLDHIQPYVMPCLALPYTYETSLTLPYLIQPRLLFSRISSVGCAPHLLLPSPSLFFSPVFFSSTLFSSLHSISLHFSSLLLTSPFLSCPILVLYASNSLLRPSKLLVLYYLFIKTKFV